MWRYCFRCLWISSIFCALPVHRFRQSHCFRFAFGARTPSASLRTPFSLWWCTVELPLCRTKIHPFCWFTPKLNHLHKETKLNIKLNSRHNWITAWLQCQRTTIEALHRILANATLICAISRLGCITFLLMIRVNGPGRTIPRVTCHHNSNSFTRSEFEEIKCLFFNFCFFFCHPQCASMLIR